MSEAHEHACIVADCTGTHRCECGLTWTGDPWPSRPDTDPASPPSETPTRREMPTREQLTAFIAKYRANMHTSSEMDKIVNALEAALASRDAARSQEK